MAYFESPVWVPTRYVREMSDEEIAWRAEQEEAEAHIQMLIDKGLCVRCESANTENVTGEYDCCQVRRCFDCGYRYTNEF